MVNVCSKMMGVGDAVDRAASLSRRSPRILGEAADLHVPRLLGKQNRKVRTRTRRPQNKESSAIAREGRCWWSEHVDGFQRRPAA